MSQPGPPETLANLVILRLSVARAWVDATAAAERDTSRRCHEIQLRESPISQKNSNNTTTKTPTVKAMKFQTYPISRTICFLKDYPEHSDKNDRGNILPSPSGKTLRTRGKNLSAP